MTVKEFKGFLENVDDDFEIGICVDTPGGFVCPDGCVIPIEYVSRGFDWHTGEMLIVPKYRLKMTEKSEKDWSERK